MKGQPNCPRCKGTGVEKATAVIRRGKVIESTIYYQIDCPRCEAAQAFTYGARGYQATFA